MTRSSDLGRKIASRNYLLASRVWRQGHEGFTCRDPVSSTTW
jgi:phosphoketolase